MEPKESLELNKISDVLWEIPRTGSMKVPCRVYASEKMLEKMKQDRTLMQGRNVTFLPGIYKYAIIMPDGHEGYGFPIGGVAALDYEKGGISPGGIGYDINCGVRLLSSNLKREEVVPKVKALLESLFRHCPAGLGSSNIRVNSSQLNDILKKGARWAVENGYGNEDDLKHCEEEGCMEQADSSNVSEHAKDRGKKQIATLGSGNHFLEIQYVEKIFHKEAAKAFGLEEGQVTFMIHCLPGDAKILSGHGYTLKISELENKWTTLNVKCMDIKKHNLTETNVIKFFKLKQHSGMFKIATKSGKELVATGDHPILTPNGLRFMKDIKKGEIVAVLSYEGVEYEEPSPDVIVDEEDIRRIGSSERTIKNLKKKGLLPLRFNSEHLPILAKLLGFLTGDGWLGKNKDRWTAKFIGDPEDLENIRKDISRIGYKATQPYKLYSKSKIIYSDGEKRTIEGSSYQIVITSLGLPMLFYALGAPFGNKSKTKFRVPRWIFDAPLWIKRLYLAGFFGAELTAPSNPKNERYRFRNPLLSINKLEELKSNGYEFLKEISKLLEEFDIKTIKILEQKGVITKKGRKTLKLRLKISSKKDNLIRLWSRIGYEYCQHRTILSAHALQYLNFEQNSLKKESVMTGKPESRLLITSHKFRSNDITTFSDFVNSFRLNPPTPIMWDIIESKEEIKNYRGYVYDFTVSHKDHNFVADGFVTGNCGSRGLGHQVCSDYLREMERTFPEIVKGLPDRELIYAPAGSPMADKYFKAMCAAANFAWCNRHVLGHQTRLAVSEVLGDKAKLETVYDVAHNICKVEAHMINGEKKKVWMHRKGATRAFGPGNPEIPEAYREVGQPIILPGSMGTSSYVLVGTNEGMEETFGSTAHGAGRVMSRHEAIRSFRGENIVRELEKKGIFVKGASWKGIAEEASAAYKDVDEVVRVSDEANIGKIVVRLKPIGVVKG